MNFIYYYKTCDGMRHEAEMAAPSRDEVFAALRAQGIRPIKVVAKDAKSGRSGIKKRMVFAVAVAAAVAAAAISWMMAMHSRGINTASALSNDIVTARQTVGRMVVVQPLARQRIPGNRKRIENVPSGLFANPSEMFLARFAEPGSKADEFVLTPETEADFAKSLKEPVMVAEDELSEYIDLKRIVAGMKREMSAYLAGGGTVQGYAVELVKRQKMEIAYREKAEKHLEELLAPKSGEMNALTAKDLSVAYAYWLKANASLQSMGIAPLMLPDALRTYQMSLDIDDAEGLPTIETKVIESPPVALPEKRPLPTNH